MIRESTKNNLPLFPKTLLSLPLGNLRGELQRHRRVQRNNQLLLQVGNLRLLQFHLPSRSKHLQRDRRRRNKSRPTGSPRPPRSLASPVSRPKSLTSHPCQSPKQGTPRR